MSEKAIKLPKNKSYSKIIWWGAGILSLVLTGTIAVSVSLYLTESKNNLQRDKINSLLNESALQKNEINALKKLSDKIADNRAKIEENTGNIQLYSLNFNDLKNEVGNNKVTILTKQVSDVIHRMESIEETKNQEALILSLALIIKENVLFDKDYSRENDILQQMAFSQENIKNELAVLNSLKNIRLKNEYILAEEFNTIVADFSFDTANREPTNDMAVQQKTTVEKSIELIKDTMAGINFDKVIKTDKKTDEQKQILKNLKDLVNLHKFDKALDYIKTTPEFATVQNDSLTKWCTDVQNKLSFDKAISVIIASELSALREDFNNSVNADN